MNLAVLACIEEGRVPPECCGTAACTHTVVDHSGHVGYIVDGHLYCRPDEHGPLIPHSLDLDERCSVVKLLDHVHGPNCGHEIVAHGDHFDFLVGDELHHVPSGDLDGCCPRGCIAHYASGTILHHGRLSVMRQRKKGSPEKPFRAAYEPLVEEGVAPPFGGVRRPDETGVSNDAITVTKIYASGICCPSEVPLIINILRPLPGVAEVEVAVVTKTVTVRHTGAFVAAAAVAALNEARLDACLQAPRQSTQPAGSWVPPWRVLVSAGLLAVSLLHYLHTPTHTQALDYLKYVALGAIALEAPLVGLKAFASLRRKVLDINFLMFLAVAGAVALQDYVEGAAVLVLFSVAQWLEARSTAAARAAIASVLALKPQNAILADTGAKVPVDDVAVGTDILVRPGDKVPLDGLVTAGTSRLDNSMLTGESAPVKRAPGQEVFGGTVNCGDGALTVRTTAAASDTTVARLARLVEEATARQSPTETYVNRFAKWYTPIVVFACLCLALAPLAARVNDPKWWVYLALQILVTACPCALVLSTPVTMVAALAAAAKQGILIKGGQVLEALAGAKVVTFDKTGTLTEGRCRVVMSKALGGADEARMLSLAASAERTSSHPVAVAIVGCAAAAGAPVNLPVAACFSVPGQGIVAEVDGEEVAVGNARLLAERAVGHDLALMAATEAEWSAQGATVSWVAAGGNVVGVFAVADATRAEAAEAVSALRGAHLKVAMLTGDNAGAGQSVAAAAGIEYMHASLLPEDKLRQVEEYRAKCGRVVHIGDGINDAPALAAADVGIAMGANGAAIAVEAADVALFSNDLRCLLPIIRLGRTARRKIFENITLSVVTKVAVLALAAAGKFSLWAAVAVDAGTALVVIANGMTLLRWRRAQDACAVKSACRSRAANLKTGCSPGASANAAADGIWSDAKTSGCTSTGRAPGECYSQKADRGCKSAAHSHCHKSHGHSHSHGHGESDDTAAEQSTDPHAQRASCAAKEKIRSCCSRGGSGCTQGTATKSVGCGSSSFAAHGLMHVPLCNNSTHAGEDVANSNGCTAAPLNA
ncbi:g3772 [Coccomyxa elongata]